jgi:hypothetical protein
MFLPRLLRKSSAVLAIGAILFAQIAIAAHACAAFAQGGMPAPAAMGAHGEGANCDEMNAGQANPDPVNLCFEHCQKGFQSVDSHPVPFVLPPAAPIYVVELPDPLSALRSTPQYSRALLARVTAPPLAVRNCCFRT